MLCLRANKIEGICDSWPVGESLFLTICVGKTHKTVRLIEHGGSNGVYNDFTWADFGNSVELMSGTRVTATINKQGVGTDIAHGASLIDKPGVCGVALYTQDEQSRLLCVLTVSVTADLSDSRRPSGSIPSEPGVGNIQSSPNSVTADILAHFFADISSTKQLIDTYKKWAIRCGPLRFACESLVNILKWRDPHATGCFLVVWIWICRDPQSAMVFLFPLLFSGSLYYLLLLRTGASSLRVIGSWNDPEFFAEDVEQNLRFNNQIMSIWCDIYDRCKSIDSSLIFHILPQLSPLKLGLVIVVYIALYMIPTYITLISVVVIPVVYTCPVVGSNKAVVTSLLTPQSNISHLTKVLEVYENQRWWLGNWSDKGLAIGLAQIYPWSDETGKVPKNKSDISPPPGFEWQDLWHVDDRGWMYAINFETEWFHPDQRSADFVRKRRWIRSAHAVASE